MEFIMADKPLLLSIIEVGGYPDFAPLYRQLGYEVCVESNMRKVLKFLKKNEPSVVIAEFNFQSDFRDRTGSLETLMAVIQRFPDIKIIVFFDKEYSSQFERLQSRFSFNQTMVFPIDQKELERVIQCFST